MKYQRREILKLAALATPGLFLPKWSFAQSADAHFFLLIVLNGGADPSYLFDARPLSMTRAGKIQNYLGREPGVWTGSNGISTRATSLTRPFEEFRDRMSILNGVVMDPSFDGHPQNMNLLFTGNSFGGESFLPHLNASGTPASLDAIAPALGTLSVNVTNHSGVVPLAPPAVGPFAQVLRNSPPIQGGTALADFIRARMSAVPGNNRFAAAADLMLAGLDRAPTVHERLARLQAADPAKNEEQQAAALIGACFKQQIARSAMFVLPEKFDVHSADDAKNQPAIFTSAVNRVVTLLRGLKEMPFDNQRSMLDMTTFVVASEIGRTLRSSADVLNTGTDHNQFGTSVLIGGKGIKGGMVIGASDLADENETPSGAHLAMDAEHLKVMGRPFDFETLRARTDKPNEFDIKDYLTIGSVVNTIYAAFKVGPAHTRNLGRDKGDAKILAGLLT